MVFVTHPLLAAMSAFGPKRTSVVAPHMSAFGGKADIKSKRFTRVIGGALTEEIGRTEAKCLKPDPVWEPTILCLFVSKKKARDAIPCDCNSHRFTLDQRHRRAALYTRLGQYLIAER
jgi:hypothetical protein